MTDSTERVERLIRHDVFANVSSLVATLAQGYDAIGMDKDAMGLSALTEQAWELASPVLDYEEAARQEGWEPFFDAFGVPCWSQEGDGNTFAAAHDGQTLCEEFGIEAYEWEVYEHWIVSPMLAEKLVAIGERVDQDFAGLCVWARTVTGQAISLDGTMQKVVVLLDKVEAA